jgi:hypothetical protein
MIIAIIVIQAMIIHDHPHIVFWACAPPLSYWRNASFVMCSYFYNYPAWLWHSQCAMGFLMALIEIDDNRWFSQLETAIYKAIYTILFHGNFLFVITRFGTSMAEALRLCRAAVLPWLLGSRIWIDTDNNDASDAQILNNGQLPQKRAPLNVDAKSGNVLVIKCN